MANPVRRGPTTGPRPLIPALWTVSSRVALVLLLGTPSCWFTLVCQALQASGSPKAYLLDQQLCSHGVHLATRRVQIRQTPGSVAFELNMRQQTPPEGCRVEGGRWGVQRDKTHRALATFPGTWQGLNDQGNPHLLMGFLKSQSTFWSTVLCSHWSQNPVLFKKQPEKKASSWLRVQL